jgi:hypothetical protein
MGSDDIITLAKKFDCIIIFDQPIESYDNRDLYCITKQVSLILKNIINKPVQILGSSDV